MMIVSDSAQKVLSCLILLEAPALHAKLWYHTARTAKQPQMARLVHISLPGF